MSIGFFKRATFSILATLFLSSPIGAQETKEVDVATDNVIAQMNYCITSLTNIINCKSIAVLEEESDNLINNLTMEQLIGLHEIKDLRIDLLDAISKFGITEQERLIIKRLQSIKRDNAKWQALANALRPTNLIMGPGMGTQVAYQTMLTAARSVVEYRQAVGELEGEELNAMWNLRKEDLKTINNIRKQALGIIFDLYNKYHLEEGARLTEATAEQFTRYTTEVDPYKRIRLLKDNYNTYKFIGDYYYHLGMAYLDINDYTNAKENFSKYSVAYSKAPILRYDAKSGCIALAILQNERGLAKEEIEELINQALKNLPNNSAAILQCALTYINIGEEEKGFNLLRSNLDDPMASDKSITALACANLLAKIKRYPAVYNVVKNYFENGTYIDLDSYILYQINNSDNAWTNIAELFSFENITQKPWYQHMWLWNLFFKETPSLSKKLTLKLPKNITANTNDFFAYKEEHDKSTSRITQLNIEYQDAIPLKKIEKVKCFKEYDDLKYLFVNSIVPDELFILKEGIDIDKIKSEQYPRMSEFVLTESDIKKIVKFCTKNKDKTSVSRLRFKPYEETIVNKHSENIEFLGDSLAFEPIPFEDGNTYVRYVFGSGVNILFKYDNDNKALIPYLYSYEGKSFFSSSEIEEDYNQKLISIYAQEEVKEGFFVRIWNGILNLATKAKDFIKNLF